MSAKDHTFTLGIEEEFAIVDPETRELRSHIHEILEGGKSFSRSRSNPRCTSLWWNLARRFAIPSALRAPM